MERVLSRAAVAAALMVAVLPVAASADKPAATPGNGPSANPGHGPKADPPGRAVRAHGAPSRGNSSTHRAAPAHPAHPTRPAHPAARPKARGAAPAQPHTNNGAAHQKTTICHATGSATNPYVQIRISNRALNAHARHQDGRDIIPAPGGGCPTAAAASAQQGATAGQTIAAAPQTQAAPGAESHVLGVTETNRRAAPAGASASSPAAATGGPLASTERSRDNGSLPFTGLDLALALVIAAGLLLAGVALRRVAVARRSAA